MMPPIFRFSSGERHVYKNAMPNENMLEVTFIGFGEAAQTFTRCWRAANLPLLVRAYDIKQDDPAGRQGVIESFSLHNVTGIFNLAEAMQSATIIISAVTAGQALRVARDAALNITGSALYFDINSVTPETKHLAMAVVENAGGKYVDVAIMAPVDPLGLKVPTLVAGAHADLAVQVLTRLGFSPRAVTGGVGAAASIKMIRSIVTKGIEALTAECILAAFAAGVEEDVIASLDSSWPGYDWRARTEYNLDRMMVHGQRRGEEMNAARDTLIGLGFSGEMSAATAIWQSRIGRLGLKSPPGGLARKIEEIRQSLDDRMFE